MARPRKPPSVKAEKERQKCTLGDTASMKHLLDNAASQAVLSQGYTEDKFFVFLKLGLELLAIVLALVAQFYPGKLKENWWLIFACIAGYAGMTGGLSALSTFKEQDGILFTKKRESNGIALKVSAKMPRFSSMYTLKIEAIDKKEHLVRKPVESEKSVALYFYSDGYFNDQIFKDDVKKLLHQFEQKD